ncbi:unnamed protein product, partial [Symbiodinium sp. KB8]
RFYRPDEELARDLREAVKLAFDAGAHSACVTVPLPELYVDGFDADQIWEEFEVQHKGALGALDKRLDVLLGRLEQVALPSALVPRHLPSADVAQHSSSDSGSVGSADSSDSTDSSQDLDHGSDRTDTEAEPGEEALQDLVADMDAFDAAHQGLALEGTDEDGDDLIDYSKPVPQAGGSGQPIMY